MVIFSYSSFQGLMDATLLTEIAQLLNKIWIIWKYNNIAANYILVSQYSSDYIHQDDVCEFQCITKWPFLSTRDQVSIVYANASLG